MAFAEIVDLILKQLDQFGAQFITYADLGAKYSDFFMHDKDLLICGMGGSGIAGRYIKKLNQVCGGSRTVNLNQDYDFPNNFHHNYNAIIVSYSGNTEETISMAKMLEEKQIKMLIMSSGGYLAKFAKDKKLLHIALPLGFQPRMAFPAMFGLLFGLVSSYLSLSPLNDQIRSVINSFDTKYFDPSLISSITETLLSDYCIIVTTSNLDVIATRFRCQLNENSKMHAMAYTVPEFNHNGIVGYDGTKTKASTLIIDGNTLPHSRIKLHLKFLSDYLRKHEYAVVTIKARSQQVLAEILELTLLLDLISINLAVKRNVNPESIPSLLELKQLLKNN